MWFEKFKEEFKKSPLYSYFINADKCLKDFYEFGNISTTFKYKVIETKLYKSHFYRFVICKLIDIKENSITVEYIHKYHLSCNYYTRIGYYDYNKQSLEKFDIKVLDSIRTSEIAIYYSEEKINLDSINIKINDFIFLE